MNALAVLNDDDPRSRALAAFERLDGPSDPSFGGVARLAASILDAAGACVSLIAPARAPTRPNGDAAHDEAVRQYSFSAYVEASGKPLVVVDALDDDRFRNNPLVTGGPNIRFYAGIPCRLPDGPVLGVLGVIDTKPRGLSAKEQEQLELLAQQVVEILQATRAACSSEEDRLARLALDFCPAAIAYRDADLKLRFANPIYDDWFQVELASGREKGILELLGRNDSSIRQHLTDILRGTPRTFVLPRGTNPNRPGGHTLVNALPRIVDGEVRGVFFFGTDVTAQVRAESRLREIVEHMRDAVLVFGGDCLVEEVQSSAATRTFGSDASGKDVRDLLFPQGDSFNVDRELLSLWITAAFDSCEEGWKELEPSSPRFALLAGDGSPEGALSLELDFRPVFEFGKLVRIVLLVSDVSETARLSSRLAQQQQLREDAMRAMRRLIERGPQAFIHLVHSASDRLAACRTLVEGGEPTRAVVERFLLLVSSVNEDATLLDVRELSVLCQDLEFRTMPMLTDEGAAGLPWIHRRFDLLLILTKCHRVLDSLREVVADGAPAGRAALDQTTVHRGSLRALEDLVSGRDDEVAVAVRSMSSRPFGDCVASVSERAHRWCENFGKRALVVVRGREVTIPRELAECLPVLLAHLVRSSIADGLEAPRERLSAGKAETGVIVLAAEEPRITSDSVVIRVRDDGAGIDASAKVESASAVCKRSREAVAHFLKRRTSIRPLGGEGQAPPPVISLNAVREELHAIGYEMHAFGRPGQFTEVVIARSGMPTGAGVA